MSKQANRTCDFHIRMSQKERAEFDALAKSCGMSRSELIRLLAKLPASEIAEGNLHLVAVDTAAVARIHREMRRFGTNFNQAVHALNSINFYLKNGSLRYEYLDLAIPEITAKLDSVEGQQASIRSSLSAMESAILIGV